MGTRRRGIVEPWLRLSLSRQQEGWRGEFGGCGQREGKIRDLRRVVTLEEKKKPRRIFEFYRGAYFFQLGGESEDIGEQTGERG